MPGNLRKRTGAGRGSGRTEAAYLRARKRAGQLSQICAECGQAIDMTLKPICQFIDTSTVGIGEAHLVPLNCGPECRELKHYRKPNPWSFSADHKIPVATLNPDSPLLTSHKNLASVHLCCNQSKGDRKSAKPMPKTSRDWFK